MNKSKRTCPCGYKVECAVHCGNGHNTGECPRYDTYVSDLEPSRSDGATKPVEPARLTLWQRLKLWLNYCPTCNTKLFRQSIKQTICTKCGKDWRI